MREVGEECGLACASCAQGNCLDYLYKMLLQQQNRGQVSAGFTTFHPDRSSRLSTRTSLGLVSELFSSSNPGRSKAIINKYSGPTGIGHVRYSTCGVNDKSYAQPFEREHGRVWKWFSVAFNGNIANYAELKKELEKHSYHLRRDSDTEVLMHFLGKQLAGENRVELVDLFENACRVFDGAYNIVFLNGLGEMVAARDPIGFKPLCYANREGLSGAASESIALKHLGLDHIDLKPGELLYVGNDSVEVKKFARSPVKARCMFEWVYFANVSSVIDRVSVYNARWNLGKELARLEPLTLGKDHVVIHAPDTAKPMADSYAFMTGLPSKEGLVRNRSIGRTFIGSDREKNVLDKYSIIREVTEGKKVILVDDSVVRGTTSRRVVDFLREEGKAREVHMRIACPPIKYPCFYGIDMSTLGELIAARSRKDVRQVGEEGLKEDELEKVRREINADSIVYQSVEGLVKALGMPKRELCLACLTGNYPTPYGEILLEKAARNYLNGEKSRTYE